MTEKLTWRQAREALTDDGRGVNDAQGILDDLAHFPGRQWSYRAADGVRWLTYAGPDAAGQPVYISSRERLGKGMLHV
jgi:hypothetical protein